jgi:hypothetical protein
MNRRMMITQPGHARIALRLFCRAQVIRSPLCDGPPESLRTTRWQQGLSRASIRMYSLLQDGVPAGAT